MKKVTSMILVLALAIAVLAGCGAKQPEATQPAGGIEGTPQEIIEKIYAQHKEIQLAIIGMDVDLADGDAVLYNLGLDSADKLEAAAVSETMMGQPYSLVVARVKNAADAADVAKEMYEKIDTRKWICVMADTKVAAYSGDVVMFFMINSDFAEDATPDSMAEAFKAACGGNATVIS